MYYYPSPQIMHKVLIHLTVIGLAKQSFSWQGLKKILLKKEVLPLQFFYAISIYSTGSCVVALQKYR